MNPSLEIESGGLCLSNHAARDSDEPTRAVRAAIDKSLLALGATVVHSSEEHLAFRLPSHNWTLVFQYSASHDPNYVRLLLPSFFTLAGPAQRGRAQALMSQLGASCKLAHLFLLERRDDTDSGAPEITVNGDVEMLLPLPPQGAPVDWDFTGQVLDALLAPPMLLRWVGSLHHAAMNFVESMDVAHCH